MRRKLIGLAIALVPWMVYADPEKDYAEGIEAYDVRGDVVGAMVPLKRAADGGHPKAQSAYAFLLDQADDDVEAVKYYRMAAKTGDPDGRFGLAKSLLTGEGVEKNVEEGRNLIRQGAESGHRQSMVVLWKSLIQGGMGIDTSKVAPEEIMKWLTKAVEFKDIESMQQLQNAHAQGLYGLPKSPEQAQKIGEEINRILGVAKKDEKPKRRRR